MFYDLRYNFILNDNTKLNSKMFLEFKLYLLYYCDYVVLITYLFEQSFFRQALGNEMVIIMIPMEGIHQMLQT